MYIDSITSLNVCTYTDNNIRHSVCTYIYTQEIKCVLQVERVINACNITIINSNINN